MLLAYYCTFGTNKDNNNNNCVKEVPPLESKNLTSYNTISFK